MGVLDTRHAPTIADAIVGVLEESGGYTVEEMIPGLVQAIVDLANDADIYLDAAANLLADGGVRHLQEYEDDSYET